MLQKSDNNGFPYPVLANTENFNVKSVKNGKQGSYDTGDIMLVPYLTAMHLHAVADRNVT